jgi:hypothetical protein
VKHFCPVEAQNLTRPKTRVRRSKSKTGKFFGAIATERPAPPHQLNPISMGTGQPLTRLVLDAGAGMPAFCAICGKCASGGERFGWGIARDIAKKILRRTLHGEQLLF